MQTTGIRDYFKALVLSDHIGINKPRRELFEHALSSTGSTVSDSIMVGDMFETDIVGAANVGIDQIFFNSKGIEKKPFEPTYEVRDLKEIIGIL
jgi:putative hydrolase of the HAD superfamily